jgi:hypothetical protein
MYGCVYHSASDTRPYTHSTHYGQSDGAKSSHYPAVAIRVGVLARLYRPHHSTTFDYTDTVLLRPIYSQTEQRQEREQFDIARRLQKKNLTLAD